MSITNASAFRRTAGAAAIVAFFCLLLASTLLEPTDSHANGDELRAAALHPGAMQASAWCEILAGVLDHIAPAITVLFFALPVALVLLAGAVVRAGLAPRWVIPVAVLFLLTEFVPVPGAEIIQMGLGLAAFGRIALTIFGMSDAEWESALAAGALSPGRPATAPTVA